MNSRFSVVTILILAFVLLSACDRIPPWLLDGSPEAAATEASGPQPTAVPAATATPIDQLVVTSPAQPDQAVDVADAPPVVDTTPDPRLTRCTDNTTGSSMTYNEALVLAQNSACIDGGDILPAHFCNAETGTWWISLNSAVEGCSPACVVDVNNQTAQVNWRCLEDVTPPADPQPEPPPDESSEEAVSRRDRFYGWQGAIFKQPHGSLVEYRLLRDDGLWFDLASQHIGVREQFAAAAWTGAGVSMTGEVSDTPGLLNVDAILQQEALSAEPRDLTAFAMAASSSDLPVDSGGAYSAWSVVDGKPASPWCEGVEESGIGEWIQLDFSAPIEIAELRLTNGYESGENLYDLNGRVQVARIYVDGEELDTWQLPDVRGTQTLKLAGGVVPGVSASSLRLVISDIYTGSAYADTCIAEIAIWGRPAK